MYLNRELEEAIDKSTTRAVIQSVVIPAIIFIVLLMVKKDWAGLSFCYWIIPMIYYSISKKDDFTGKIFFRIVLSLIAIVAIFALMVIS